MPKSQQSNPRPHACVITPFGGPNGKIISILCTIVGAMCYFMWNLHDDVSKVHLQLKVNQIAQIKYIIDENDSSSSIILDKFKEFKIMSNIRYNRLVSQIETNHKYIETNDKRNLVKSAMDSRDLNNLHKSIEKLVADIQSIMMSRHTTRPPGN